MMRTVSLLLWLSPAVVAQHVPEGPEPNSSPATATVLACGQEAFGFLANSSDEDWYKVVLVATADLRCETGPGPGGEIGDTALSLYDAGGAPLQGNDNGVGVGYYSSLQAPGLTAGIYYVVVEAGAAAAGSGSYTLDVRCLAPSSPPAPPVVAEGPENNDPRLGGTATTVALNARCSGTLSTTGPGGDWDFYRFLLLDDGFVQVRVNATPSHPTPPVMDDPILYLYDASSPPNLLAGPFYASNYGVWDTAIELRLPAGLYQVAIRGWVGSVAGHYYLDLFRSDAARLTVHAGGCGGRTLDVATTLVGPLAPRRLERPVLGTTYSLLGSGLGSQGIVLHVIGFLPTLLDLTPFGAVGCFLNVVSVDTQAQLADGQGKATFFLALPETPSLVGATLESQLAVLDYSNPLGITTSNSVSAIVGN